MKPDDNNLSIGMYTDVDFIGLYATEDKLDPISVKIRTSVLLTF